MTKRFRNNDSDREDFVRNDEGWYRRQMASRLSEREFTRRNRVEIDAALKAVVDSTARPHALAYGR